MGIYQSTAYVTAVRLFYAIHTNSDGEGPGRIITSSLYMDWFAAFDWHGSSIHSNFNPRCCSVVCGALTENKLQLIANY